MRPLTTLPALPGPLELRLVAPQREPFAQQLVVERLRGGADLTGKARTMDFAKKKKRTTFG